MKKLLFLLFIVAALDAKLYKKYFRHDRTMWTWDTTVNHDDLNCSIEDYKEYIESMRRNFIDNLRQEWNGDIYY